MNKETKKNYIEEMKKVFSSNEAVMIAHYQGLNVVQLDELRKELRENGILFKITKNRISQTPYLCCTFAAPYEFSFASPTEIQASPCLAPR